MAAGTTKVAVAATSTQVVAENLGRKSLTIVNDSDEDIYLSEVPVGGTAAAVLNEGILIKSAGGVYDIGANSPRDRIHAGAVNAISTSGSKNVTVSELDWV